MKDCGRVVRIVILLGMWSVVFASDVCAFDGPAEQDSPTTDHARPEDVGLDSACLAHVDEIVEDGLHRGRMPGCVVMIGRGDKIVFLRAYGSRRLRPAEEPMTTDTVFDLASLTKPIATATCVMKLVELGKVRLDDPIALHLPEFGQNGKQKVTVQQLLTHQGGLIPDNALSDYDHGRDEAFRRIHALKLYVEPGTKFVYTDVGYIVLAELVRKLTGKDIHEYSQKVVFGPLGMSETGFLPSAEMRQRAATTEQRDDRWMRGEVHDPRAFRLGGVAGHAGLFSTAEDLATYASMMLGGGEFNGKRVLESKTVDLMTTPQTVSSGLRGLGWDIRTGYSSNRGDLFTQRAVGHGGFTGTTFWIDPGHDLFVVFLSNRVHPDGKGSVNVLAGRIGTIAAAAIRSPKQKTLADGTANTSDSARHRTHDVRAGIDVLQRDNFRQLEHRNVGLMTNQTGMGRDGTSTVELLQKAELVNLVALFSPEHGFAGELDVANIADSTDAETGLKVFSLYGKTRVPSPASLQGIDTLVFDIQDIGTRFYTYISTMGGAMRVAAEHDIRFVVLDRPNPLGGREVQGPVLDAGSESFVGFHRIPVRHGMTTGELALMLNAELELGLDLTVVRVEGWRRGDLFDTTGLVWVNPSPNMRSLTQALIYPGLGLLETTNLSVGRGTDTPFEVVGAPWIDGRLLARFMNTAGLRGVRFVPIRFTPAASQFKGRSCGGVNLLVTDRDVFDPLAHGLTMAVALRQLYPADWETHSLNRLLASQTTRDAILAGSGVAEIVSGYDAEVRAFKTRRQKFLLYE